MLEVHFRPAWGLDDSRIARDAQEFWRDLQVLGAKEIGRRVSELCAAAYLGESMVGVSTAHFGRIEHLKARFLFFRLATAPAHRRNYVSYRLAAYSRDLLEQWSADHLEEEVAGMAAYIQAGEYKSKQCEPVWPDWNLNLNLVGYDQFGTQIRVAWFKHAVVK